MGGRIYILIYELIFKLTVALMLIVNGFFDLRSRNVYSLLYILGSVIGILSGGVWWLCILTILCCLLLKDRKDAKIGAGDIDSILFCISGFYSYIIIILLFTMLLCLAYWLIKKRKDIPFVAALAAGTILSVPFQLL